MASSLVAGAYIFIEAGEIMHPHSIPPSTILERTGFVLVNTACAGMLAAWRWDLPGAALSVTALVAFKLLIWEGHREAAFVFTVPGFLFLVDWVLRRPLEASC